MLNIVIELGGIRKHMMHIMLVSPPRSTETTQQWPDRVTQLVQIRIPAVVH